MIPLTSRQLHPFCPERHTGIWGTLALFLAACAMAAVADGAETNVLASMVSAISRPLPSGQVQVQ